MAKVLKNILLSPIVLLVRVPLVLLLYGLEGLHKQLGKVVDLIPGFER
mgnify:CR=1